MRWRLKNDHNDPLVKGSGKELWEIASKMLDIGGVLCHRNDKIVNMKGMIQWRMKDKSIYQRRYLQRSAFLITTSEVGTNVIGSGSSKTFPNISHLCSRTI